MSKVGAGAEAKPGASPLARKRARRVPAEFWAWVFMRLSGVLLLFLVLGHLFVIRILAGMNEVDLAFVTVRWSGMGWRSYDFAMLLLAMVHGANGVRGLVYDHMPPSRRPWVLGAVYTICLAAAVLGCYVIVAFPQPL